MKRAQTTGPKMVIFTPLLGQIGGLLGQWPTSYNVKKCPGSLCDWFLEGKPSIHFGEDKAKSILLGRIKCKNPKET